MGFHNDNKDSDDRGFVNIHFHSKGMDMVHLPSILHSKKIRLAVLCFLNCHTPPIVSYTYPKTIAGKIFNYKQTIANLDFNKGTNTMQCECNTSPYIYPPAGHVVTGNLNIIRNRHLHLKGPT